MYSRLTFNWRCRNRTLKLGRRTLVMGILNVTPDSFSDGGHFAETEAALEHALKMEAEGADIIDIGGESTRPGSDCVPLSVEIKRTIPVIEKLRTQSDVPISIDTTKAEVARLALEAGADIINDISSFEMDPSMADLSAQYQAGIVLMHMKGTPKMMQTSPSYLNVTSTVQAYLTARTEFAMQKGIAHDQIVIDPGIGFGKTVEHNLALIRNIPKLAQSGSPILIGASRKSFIGHILDRNITEDRKAGSLGTAAWALLQGAHILRVHDVIETCDLCTMLDRIASGDI